MMQSSGEIDAFGIAALLAPYILDGTHVPESLYGQLQQYLQLLLKWNARTNLTAIRDPQEIVRRHFGESLFAAQHLGNCETLLDFGSGAGFPGLPIQLLHPNLHVTLGESQNKKSTFLREVVRTLGLRTAVWAGRVEDMPSEKKFNAVTLRAVDNMSAAVEAASVRSNQLIVVMTTSRQPEMTIPGFTISRAIPIPGTHDQALQLLGRQGN